MYSNPTGNGCVPDNYATCGYGYNNYGNGQCACVADSYWCYNANDPLRGADNCCVWWGSWGKTSQIGLSYRYFLGGSCGAWNDFQIYTYGI